MSPGRPPSPSPDPFASPYPEKSVTLPRHPFSALPHPTPRTPHQSPRLRHFSPPIRPDPAISPTLLKDTYIRANLAHVIGPAAVKTRLSEPCSVPLSSSATRRHSCVPANRRRHYRFARDRGHPQLGGAQNVAETNRLPAFAGITVLGTPGNLTQARRRRSS